MVLKSRKFVIITGLLIIIAAALILFKWTQNRKPLNLVIISIDTLRPDHMSTYGYDKNTTPNIDAWAKDATVFTNVRTIIPMTYPSFTILMTGHSPFQTRIFKNRTAPVSDNTPTLATILQKQGYATGEWVTGALAPSSTNLDQGMSEDQYLAFKGYNTVKGKIIYYQTNPKQYEKFISDSVSWMDENKNKKFFLWVHMMGPHAPYTPPQSYVCKYNPQYCSTLEHVDPRKLELERVHFGDCQANPPPASITGKFESLYDGEIGYTDSLVNKVLSEIKKDGLDKNTVVMIYGDHGEGFDHDYYFDHQEVLYDSAVRIPLIIKDPAESKTGTVSTVLQNEDILPTLIDLLKVSYNTSEFAGKSFSNEFTGFPFWNEQRPKYQYFSNVSVSKFAVFDGRYKYIYSLPYTCLPDQQQEELYDITTDPYELHNIVAQNTSIKNELKANLLNYLASYNLPPAVGHRTPVKSSSTNSQPAISQSPQEPDQIKQLRNLSY